MWQKCLLEHGHTPVHRPFDHQLWFLHYSHIRYSRKLALINFPLDFQHYLLTVMIGPIKRPILLITVFARASHVCVPTRRSFPVQGLMCRLVSRDITVIRFHKELITGHSCCYSARDEACRQL